MVDFEPCEDWPQTVIVRKRMDNNILIEDLRWFGTIDPYSKMDVAKIIRAQVSARIAADLIEQRMNEFQKNIDLLKAQNELNNQSG